jgi:transcription initiation factor IIE alpha subunit
MNSKRRTYTTAEELSLTTQVEGKCPLCGASLFYTKKSRSYKEYELAHIYPLNPKPDEKEELENENL